MGEDCVQESSLQQGLKIEVHLVAVAEQKVRVLRSMQKT